MNMQLESMTDMQGFARINNNNPRDNNLLASLPFCELNLFEHELELVSLTAGQVLCEPRMDLTHVFFPTTAVISILYTTQEGISSEIVSVGNDGVVGVSVFMGGNSTQNQFIVQTTGLAYRMRVHAATNAMNNSVSLLGLLLRYAQAMIAQITQTAVCNRHHSIEKQLSRRLLQALDRIETNDIVMTQEQLANMLGVRRESVTAAALKLQEAAIINYSRGHINVLDRTRLLGRSCECYAIVKKEQQRLAAHTIAANASTNAIHYIDHANTKSPISYN